MLQAMSASTPGVTDTVSTTIDELVLADEPERWSALGFTVLDDRVQLGLGAPAPRRAGRRPRRSSAGRCAA